MAYNLTIEFIAARCYDEASKTINTAYLFTGAF
jgi:hypothetical protein